MLTLTACAQWQAITQVGHNEACEGITNFYTAVSLLPPEAGQEMVQALRVSQVQDNNPCDQLRLVMLLGKPDTAFHDNTEAARLVQDFLYDPDYAQHPDRGLASLLADNIKERQQLQEKLRSQEKSLTLEQAVSQRLAKKLKREHAAAKALKSQLEQLKSIEQDINEKEQSAAVPNGKQKSR
ncbi:MAG TPA: hypothetical protein ENK04_13005 [Gammaproteobacteria bacterium]|nr:hypothetical protein [Gammaproteobacteria bacterium]